MSCVYNIFSRQTQEARPQDENHQEEKPIIGLSQIKKVVTAGDANTGKTSIIRAFQIGSIDEKQHPTISDISEFNVQTQKGPVHFHLIDTAGQEIYQSLSEMYFRNADAALLVFDITNEESFENLPKWISLLQSNSPNVEIFLVANKLDLEDERVIFSNTIENFAFNNQIKTFLEVSAKELLGIRELFESLSLYLAK